MELDSRTRILNAALTQFDQWGYEGTSMDAIRAAAGFRTKSSLYAHFSSKEQIAATLLDRILAEEAAAVGAHRIAPDEATLEDVLDLAEQMTLWGLSHSAACRFCFLQWQGALLGLSRSHTNLEATAGWAVAVIRRLQQSGGAARDLDPGLLVTACTGLMNQVIAESGRGQQALSPAGARRLARQVRELCRAILCP